MPEKNSFPIEMQAPTPFYYSQLRALWKDAFGDTDAFLDTFAATAFSPNRCRCMIKDKEVLSVLYWFDCSFQEKPIAYIYAVATKKAYQGQGLCRQLMENTHQHLHMLGYEGAILVPGSDTLFAFYEKIGYQTCAYLDEIHAVCTNNKETAFPIRKLEKEAYQKLRRQFLPADAVLQEKENLDFLETQAQFFSGDDFLLAACIEAPVLKGFELLGNTAQINNILQALHCLEGTFRTPGTEIPFAMYYPLGQSFHHPKYFAFAFD